MNQAFCRLSGLSRDGIGKPITELLPGIEEDPEDWIEKYSRVATDGGEIEFEAFSEILEKWFHVIAYSPKPDYFITLFTDISSRKNAEEKLRQQEKKFRILFERSHDAIFVVDSRTGRYLDANKSAEKLTGRTIDELKKLRTIEVTPTGAKNRLKTINEAGDITSFGEVEYFQPDGLKRIAYLSTIHLDDHRVFRVARDITNERYGQQRYKTILQTTQDGYWISDEDGNILEVNKVLCDVLGYSRQELLSKTVADIDLYENEDQVRDHIRKLKQVGSLQFESRHIHKQGHLIDVEVSTTYLQDFGGRCIVFVHDISEHKSIIRQLQESESRFRSLVHSMRDIVFTMNQDHVYTGIFGQWTEEDRFTPENFLGRSARDIFGPEQATVHEKAVGRALRGEYVVYDWEFSGPEPVYFQTSLSPMETDGVITGIVGVGRDVTEKKLTIQALKESKERLQLAVDASGIGLWEWNIVTGVTTCNDDWTHLLGYTAGELDTTSPGFWEENAHPDDMQMSKHLLQEYFEGEKNHYECEIRLKHKSGDWIWVNSRGKVVEWTAAGEPLRMIGTHTEITESKKREQRKEQQIAHLQHILSPLDQGVGILDHGNRITFINQAAAQLFGQTKDHLIGQHITSLVSERDWNKLLQAFLKLQTTTGDDYGPVKLTLQSLESLQTCEHVEAYVWPVADSSGLNGALIKLEIVTTDTESSIKAPDADDIVTLCSSCRQLKYDENNWVSLESYLKRKYNTPVSHGLCPDCLQSLLEKSL